MDGIAREASVKRRLSPLGALDLNASMVFVPITSVQEAKHIFRHRNSRSTSQLCACRFALARAFVSTRDKTCFVPGRPCVLKEKSAHTGTLRRSRLQRGFCCAQVEATTVHSDTMRKTNSTSVMGNGAVGALTGRVLVPEKLDSDGVALLEKAGLEVVCKYDLTEDELSAVLGDFDALIVRSGTKVTRSLLEKANATRLRVIGRAGVGVDNIDLAAASERGIVVVNAPTGNCIAAAEHTVALLLALARNIAAADATIKGDQWNRNKFVGVSLVDKTLGVCGFGRIGREVARRCRALGMRILAYDPYCAVEVTRAVGAELCSSLDELLRVSDFVTVHMPLTESTENMIDRNALSKCKDGVRILNVARGGIVDEVALLEALESGKVAGAALDVFVQEPPHKYPGSPSEKVAKHPRVVATPHLGASTVEAQLDVALEVAEAVITALRGDFAPTTVNAPSLPSEMLSTLKPVAELAKDLGKLAAAFSDRIHEVSITYAFRDAEKRNATRFLRASVLQGLLGQTSAVPINYVNADVVAERRGITWTEVLLSSIGTSDAEFLRLEVNRHVYEGRVTSGMPRVTRIDNFDIDICLNGRVLAYEQIDRPGMIGLVGSILGDAGVNISFMTLGRDDKVGRALVLLGVDSEPEPSTLDAIASKIGYRPRMMFF
jgi:D-3-phosphoglycerate dehydrogenase